MTKLGYRHGIVVAAAASIAVASVVSTFVLVSGSDLAAMTIPATVTLQRASEWHLAGITGALEVAVVLTLAELQRRRGDVATRRGADLRLLSITLAVGWTVRFLLPIPEGVTAQAWSMLAIFAAMICGVVLTPLETPAVTTLALAVAVATKTVTFAEGLHAFTDEVIWLVLISFFFAEGFQKTGLGDRIALSIIKAVGSTTLGLAYGLNFAELLVAAAMPSSAARAAAVFYPITVSVCHASGSDPEKGTRMKCGAFLVECSYQATATSTCLFLTGAAQNYLMLKLASEIGIVIPSPFWTWFFAALLPSVVSFLLTPLVVMWLLPPEVKNTPEAPTAAAQRLRAMGPMSDDEKVFGTVMLGMVCLWVCSSNIGVQPVVTALSGLSLLMVTGVLTWDDCARNKHAWGTFVSFATLVGLASMLTKLGIVKWIAASVTDRIIALGLRDGSAFLVILLAYWLVHYLFASQVAHIAALYQPFLLMMVQTGLPPIPAVLALAFASNLFMTLTPYASAQSPVMFIGNFITTSEWYKAGFVFSVVYLTVWLSTGYVWWRLIGLL